MKIKKMNLFWRAKELILISLLSFFVGNINATDPSEDEIPLTGDWTGNPRSAVSQNPIFAFNYDDFIIIENNNVRTPITIKIYKQGEEVFAQSVASSFISLTIPTIDLDPGSYTLVLYNQYGGYLSGNFWK